MISTKKQTLIVLSLFFLAALAGLFLRYLNVNPLEEINYRYFVHTHSHVALLGWIHLALMLLINKLVLKKYVPLKVYSRLFYATLFSVIGMLLSFPFQGYAVISIGFSTLFILVSYVFYWVFIHYVPKEERQTSGLKCIRYALVYMLLSSLGTWAIGAVMSTLGPTSDWYRISIYFYLHFQYNGWMILGLVGLVLLIFENHDIYFGKRNFSRFLLTFHVGILLSFFISVLFTSPPDIFYLLAVIGAAIQLMSFNFLFTFFQKIKRLLLQKFTRLQRNLFRWFLVLLAGKLVMQLLAGFPQIAPWITQYKNLSIGFLHWVFLGVTCIGLFLLLDFIGMFKINLLQFSLYVVAFLGTEALIFMKPLSNIFNFSLPENYNWWLFYMSFLLVVVIGSMLGKQIQLSIRKDRP